MGNHVRDQVDDYLRDVLDRGARQGFERHITGCPACQRAVETALDTRQYFQWLAPMDAPPEPGPDFYFRVRASIDQKLARSWLGSLAAAMRPRLAYPLLLLGLLLVAWALTYESREVEEGLVAMEYPATEFVQMSSLEVERSVSQDLIMMNLVELPEEE